MACGSGQSPTCSSVGTAAAVTSISDSNCIEGCYCPKGTFLQESDGRCVREQECGCKYNEREFMPGEEIKQDCNTW